MVYPTGMGSEEGAVTAHKQLLEACQGWLGLETEKRQTLDETPETVRFPHPHKEVRTGLIVYIYPTALLPLFFPSHILP